MAKLKCAVIDDDKMIHMLFEKYLKDIKDCELVGTFLSAKEAIKNLDFKNIDLLFVDVKMPEISGLDFIKSLAKKPAIVIISAEKEYAVDGFELQVDDFLLKPIEFTRLVQTIERIRNKLEGQQVNQESIFVKKSNGVYERINLSDIYWIEALENYVTLYTDKSRIIIHSTMRSIESQLPQDRFVRIHRSYIVNIDKVEMIEDNSVIITRKGQKKQLPVARGYKDNLLRHIKLIKNK